MDTKREAKDDNHFPDCANRSSKVLPAFSCRLPVPSRRADCGRAPRDSFLVRFRRERSTIGALTSRPESDQSLFRPATGSNCDARKRKRRRAVKRLRLAGRQFVETSLSISRGRQKIFQAFSNSSIDGQEQNKFRSP